jgi:hypothetical protein
VELYWATPRDALRLPEALRDSLGDAGALAASRHGVDLAVRLRDAAYRNVHTHQRRQLVRGVSADGVGGVLPQTVSVPVPRDALFHLDAQWDHRILRPDLRTTYAALPPVVHRAVTRFDSLTALDATGDRLEMSDLKLLYLRDGADLSRPGDHRVPYPFATVRANQQVMLYFELYHLAPRPDGTTRYTLSYQVTQRAARSRLGRLATGQASKVIATTSTTVTNRGTDATAREYIALDLSDLDLGDLDDAGPSTLDITVQVTDEASGHAVARTVDLRLRPMPKATE